MIRDLIRKANGRIVIMPGSGVKEHNVQNLVEETRAGEIHIHLEKQVQSRMIFRQSSVYMGMPDQSEFEYVLTDRERIREVRNRFPK